MTNLSFKVSSSLCLSFIIGRSSGGAPSLFLKQTEKSKAQEGVAERKPRIRSSLCLDISSLLPLHQSLFVFLEAAVCYPSFVLCFSLKGGNSKKWI